jgi:hypothetical protein
MPTIRTLTISALTLRTLTMLQRSTEPAAQAQQVDPPRC